MVYCMKKIKQQRKELKTAGDTAMTSKDHEPVPARKGQNPLPEKAEDGFSPDCPKETGLITADEFYDLLMEQQEQM